jgi:zinc transporter ZupT
MLNSFTVISGFLGAVVLGGFTVSYLQATNKTQLIKLLLAFSGGFMLSIAFTHFIPELYSHQANTIGYYILLGFLIQLILEFFSGGIEHGHVHEMGEHVHAILPIVVGLSIHAFMEGIPLGFNYQSQATLPAIFLGVAAHKLPEAITLCSLLLLSGTTRNKWLILIVFALVSPLSAMMAMYYGEKFHFISNLLVYIIPLVIGSFLHISTTVLYESGTKHHELSRQKVIAVLLGVGFALATLLFHSH